MTHAVHVRRCIPGVSLFDPGCLGAILHCKSLLGGRRAKVLDRAATVDELTQVQLGVSVEVQPADNGLKQASAGNDSALDEVPLQIGVVNVLVVPVVDRLEEGLDAEVVTRGQLLLQQLLVLGEAQFLVDKAGEEPLNIVGQQLIRGNFVSLPLGGHRSQKLIVARQNDLKEAESLSDDGTYSV